MADGDRIKFDFSNRQELVIFKFANKPGRVDFNRSYGAVNIRLSAQSFKSAKVMLYTRNANTRGNDMASLVIELQKEALDPNVKVSDLLRKALIVSKKLGVTEIEEWIKKELNGYEVGHSIPEYRTSYGKVMVDDPYRGMIPVIFTHYEQEAHLSKMPFIGSAAQLEHLYGNGDSKSTILMSYSPKYERKLMESMKSKVPPVLQVQLSELYKIIDAIRNTILSWALKLEEEGILGDGMTFSKKEREAANEVSYNINNFYGDVTSSQVQQGAYLSNQTQDNTKGIDFDSLLSLVELIKGSLPEAHMPSDQIGELEGELNTLIAQAKSPKPKFLIIKESLSSIKSIIEGAAGGALVQYLPQIAAFLASISA